jgi:hypothetical protein
MRLSAHHSMFALTRFEGLLLLAFLFGSFSLTLWMTAPDGPLRFKPALTPAERLSAYHIATDYALKRAAEALGLHLSPELSGHVDSIDRLDQYTVNAKGWLADRHGDGTPSYLLAFVGGAFVASSRTNGQRPDVTRALDLTAKARQNIAYAMKFRCGVGYLPVLVGVNADRYSQLRTKPCP